jgi:hypothetical protein
MNTLTMASRPSTPRLDTRVAGRAQSRWLGRVGAALLRGLQEARQARPERELLELIERRNVKQKEYLS